MILTLKCEHGEREVYFDDGREGTGNPRPVTAGRPSFMAMVIAAAMPRCPYCERRWGSGCE